MTRLRWFLALPAILIATTGSSDAADLRDKAGLFSAEAVKKAEAELDRIEKEYKVPVALETIDSLEGRKIDSVLPEHAKAAEAKGIYILISKDDHKIEVGTARGFAKYLTKTRDVAIRDTFTREFKANDFDGGLAKGIDKIDSTLSEARAEAGGTLQPTTTTPAPRKGGRVAQAPAGGNIPGQPSGGLMGTLLIIGLGLLALFIVIKVLGALFSGGNRGYANNQRMMGPGPGMGGPMGGPGYGPGYGGAGGGGGGFMSSMFGGIGGALAGNWLYDQFSGGRHHDSSIGGASNYDPNVGASPDAPAGPDYVTPGDGGGDWGGGGGDVGGGGGGDWGGGGGDWGGGGGGDWGGGGGGDDGGSW